jgi:hypothetical protein
MPRIFISYRRDDTGGHAGRLCERLIKRFGKEQIFRDLDTIAAGADFVESIQKAVGECDVLLALIGRQWLTMADDAGRRRLDDKSDFVRLEIAIGLQRKVKVIPVLLQGAAVPQAHDLPADLKPLAQRNALSLTDAGWDADVMRLMETIQPRRRWPRYVLIALGVAALILFAKYMPFTTPPDDAAITGAVKTAFSNDSRLRAFPIEVDTVNGIVRLIGTVPTERDVDLAEEVAHGVTGVKKVSVELKAAR